MSTFDARLGLPGQLRLPLRVEIDVSGAGITLTAGGHLVSNWRFDEVAIARHDDGFHVTADDEELIISVDDATQFALELRIGEPPPDRVPLARRMTASPSTGWWHRASAAMPAE